MALNSKQKKYCELYVIDFDSAGAYQKAFKVKKRATARSAASRLMLTNVDVRKYIAKLLDEQTERAKKSADDIIAELESLGFSNIKDYLSFSKSGGVKLKDSRKIKAQIAAAISEVSQYVTKRGNKRLAFKLHSKIHALELLGKHHKLWVDVAGTAENLFTAIDEVMKKSADRRGKKRTKNT